MEKEQEEILTEGEYIEALLDLLSLTRNQGWKINRGGEIRNKDGECPLCALATTLGANSQKVKDFPSLTDIFYNTGMTCTLARGKIIFAADSPFAKHRSDLLSALNITKGTRN